MSDSCGAPVQGGTIEASTTETVLQGKVLADGTPVGGAYVRLLDSTGEFTAEVVSSPEGDFRFFAAPGSWTVRALHRTGNGQAAVSAEGPGIHAVEIAVA
ncbi:DUF1416 domain-containing protein [Lentzea nigeriaca]|uniref:DUF1416 domain-containing protein n=1 Tax=Lentzea nigeriaca TaxID=1128665 RepID=UPI0019592E6A|nr:DUF1416 domain-containing protein [Lentzea nigeriaca]MBM7861323.1 putative GH25 family protein [Lentzea nigeriaca]